MAKANSAVIQFLSSSLAKFIELNSYNRQSWTISRVAKYISGSDKIEGTISDTTLGRFLDTEYPQTPSPLTVRMVSEFLIKMGCITTHHLNNLDQVPEIHIALSLNHLFGQSNNLASKKLFQKCWGITVLID